MKKIAVTIALLLMLSIFAFADDGQTPAGGKSCPNGQTCLVSNPETTEKPADATVYKKLLDFLRSVFG